MSTDVLVVAVTQGPDAGTRLVVTRTPKVIGRGHAADLVVADRGMSRAHVEVNVVGARLHARCLPGTAPLVVNGVEVEEATLAIGESFVVSDTAFTVAPSAVSASSSSSTAQATELRGLLQGLAADVKSLRSITELIDALDAAGDPPSVAQVMDAWVREHAGARGARIVSGEELRVDPEIGSLYEAFGAVLTLSGSTSAKASAVAVAAHGSIPHAFIVDLPIPSDRITSEVLRLLGVAGRMAGSALVRVEQRRSLEEDVASLRTLALGSARDFLGTSPAATEVARVLQRLAATDATALVIGESGTGKSFVARLVHEASRRAREPFRVINCAAIPENLLESELFGHERGAFSGAVASHAGAFEAVGRGTILLDEIGELALPSQAKLLRVLEERRFERVGSNRTQTVEARILAATNRDLTEMVKKGLFRQDLFFRISVVSVRIPPLRDRGDDVVLLAQQMLSDGAASAGRRVVGFDPRTVQAIRTYSWPGNVRELRNAIEHALVLGDGAHITPGDLPETIRMVMEPPVALTATDVDIIKLPARLDWLEGRAIEAALRSTRGNRVKAAAVLGINRVTLYKKLRVPAADGDDEEPEK